MAQLDGAAAVVEPPVAPLHERHQGREQVGALLGEPVALARALPGLAVVLALEQALFDELAQPRRRDGLTDADALGEVVEARRAVEGLAQDEEGGSRREDVERLGDRATVRRPRVAGLEAAGQAQDGFHAFIIADFA